MAISVTCTGVRVQNGKAYIRFGKTEREFSSLQQAKDEVRKYAQDATDFLQMLVIAKYLHVDPTASNPSLLIGKTITVDLDAAQNIVRLSNG